MYAVPIVWVFAAIGWIVRKFDESGGDNDLFANALVGLVISLPILVGLGILYALVRFIKWAWQ